MTDAMAHDLKSPMAAISAFAENLSDNVATDKREYYAGKIEEKVAQMNKMVNDILEFSKSENSPAVINKVNVDIGDVIGKAVADNEHTIDDRFLKINCDKKNITIQTDLKLFSQAISNLINNAVLYSKEGTAIDITFDEKSMVISNISEENVDNAEELKQPFVKGSTERGTKGSGLGLAIAENNFAMLGYKLEVSSDEGRFVTTIKL
jgi:signal transduction histidine kinase